MPIWLQIVIAVVGAIGTICGILGTTTYIQERQKHKAQKKNKEEDLEEAKRVEEQKKLEEIKHESYVQELKVIIGNAIKPVASKLETIENDLGLVKNGLQKDLYVDLVNLYDKYIEKGFATIGEKRDYDSLYWAYHNLGKNGVADNMHDCIMNMPDKKPRKKSITKKKGSQILLENK